MAATLQLAGQRLIVSSQVQQELHLESAWTWKDHHLIAAGCVRWQSTQCRLHLQQHKECACIDDIGWNSGPGEQEQHSKLTAGKSLGT